MNSPSSARGKPSGLSTARRSTTVRIALLLGLLGSAAALVVAATAAGRGASERTYFGSLVEDDNASVEFDVTTKNGTPSRVRFEAINFEISCEGQPPRRMSWGPLERRVIGRVFEGRDRLIPGNDGFTYLFKFEGRLLGGGGAKGFVFYRENDYDPPGGDENYAECSTDGLLRWTAERVR